MNKNRTHAEILKKSIPWLLFSFVPDVLLTLLMGFSGTRGGLFSIRRAAMASILCIFLVNAGLFIAKGRRNGFHPMSGMLSLLPLLCLWLNLRLAKESGNGDAVREMITAVSGVASSVFMLYMVYGAWDKEDLDEQFESREKEMKMILLSREQVAKKETALQRLHAQYADEIEEVCKAGEKSQKAKIQKTICEMVEMEVAAAGERTYCDNLIVNALLEEKAKACSREAIDLNVRIRLGEETGISRLHWCSIFTNLLDNAIHACGKLEEGRKWIDLQCGIRGSYICIMIKNPAARPKRSFLRADATRAHGWGMEILKDVAAAYNGYFNSRYKNGMFKATLILQSKVENPKRECAQSMSKGAVALMIEKS